MDKRGRMGVTFGQEASKLTIKIMELAFGLEGTSRGYPVWPPAQNRPNQSRWRRAVPCPGKSWMSQKVEMPLLRAACSSVLVKKQQPADQPKTP